MMLAILLFAVGTVALISLIHEAHRGQQDGEQTLMATQLAQQCLEALRNQTYASLTVGSGVMTGVSGCGSSVTSYLRSGSRSVTVSQPYTNLKQLAVTISWTTPGGTSNVSLQTHRSAI